ncbi:MAG: hypothetical protein IJE07_03380 [Clostridia bacterium]|nr:hypothetical protein [Clostridia bacterium]
MSRDCPFLKWDNDIGFFGGYRCLRTREKIVEGDSLYKNYCHDYESSYSKCPHFKDDTSSGSCFLTTACVERRGLPDDCHELTMMRKMRDEWLVNQPGGREEIAEYYAIAPCIVAHINARPDAADVWEKLYQEYILPCVAAADAGEFKRAHGVYREMIKEVSDR